MSNANEEKLGENTSQYCTVCEKDRIFTWAAWSGLEFFGYPPEREYGWECTTCGSRIRVA